MAKKSKKSLDLSFKIERSNDLNKLNPSGMSLTDIRFLAIYQSKINARNLDTRIVTFPLAEFCKIMDINQLTVTYIKNVADNIICKPVHLPSDSGKNGFMVVPLFNKCEVYQDDNTFEWFVKIKCSEEVLPYMFEMKKNYFTYELWNALKLKSVNQVRMYEILKQYENIGERTILLDDLRNMLGILDKQYKKFNDFKVKVLEVCQKALEKYTDITYTFEPIRRGRKIYALKFTITKNKDFKDDLRLKEFIKPEDLADINEEFPLQIEKPQEKSVEREKSELSSTFEDSYLPEQLKSLLDIAKSVSDNPEAYLKSIYYQIKARGKKVSNLYSYTLAIINADLKNVKPKENRKSYSYDDYEDKPSYDLDAYIEYNRKMIDMLAEPEPVETEKPIEPIKVEQEEQVKTETETQEIKFEFILDEQGYVSFDCCRRLQCILNRRCSRYYKDDTSWLLEEPHTQKEIINLILEKHQLIVKPEEIQEDDFDEIFNSDFKPF